jgi:hypothetical protein
MKTYAHINQSGDILGIGMIYFESGGLTPEVAAFVAELGEDAGIKAYGDAVKPKLTLPSGSVIEDSATSTIVIDTKDMPGDHPDRYDKTFRAAYKHGGGTAVHVDMPKAVEITKDRLRAERAPLLEAQDVAFQRAMETGDSTAAIVAEKNRLRDVTKLADRPGITLEQLKALKP